MRLALSSLWSRLTAPLKEAMKLLLDRRREVASDRTTDLNERHRYSRMSVWCREVDAAPCPVTEGLLELISNGKFG
jgi:hypothetical protein